MTAASTQQKAPRYYPAEDDMTATKKKKTSVKQQQQQQKQNPPRIRKSITPGTILILLAGRFRGKRVVCLKLLPQSGLLLVTGPYKLNGVPLRRVNPAYVIATSTKIDVNKSVLEGISHIDDDYFSRAKDSQKKGDEEEEFFEGDAPKPAVVSDERKADQQTVDAALLQVIAQTPMLEGYLAAHFTLSAKDKPHQMKF